MDEDVDPRIPSSYINWVVGWHHVSVPDDEVRASIEKRCKRVKDPDLITACGDYAVRVHQRNRQEYIDVMNGTRSQ